MKEIFVNLKRFDVPKALGGICPMDDPKEWIEWVMEESIKYGLGALDNMQLIYMLPEALIIPAAEKLKSYSWDERKTLHISSQGVYRKDVEAGVNFGAFTTNLPAAAVRTLGCVGTIIGHSEERKDKQEIIGAFEPSWNENEETREKVAIAVDQLINEEVVSALKQKLYVLMCVGETAEEKGEGTFEEQQVRIKKVLRGQLERGLKGVESLRSASGIVIGYEPIWAIGPGKTPPGKEYISFVSGYIKEVVKELYGFEIPVVYGGGLKEENAAMLGSIDTINGGLVALTNFTDPIGFNPEQLKIIIEEYTK